MVTLLNKVYLVTISFIFYQSWKTYENPIKPPHFLTEAIFGGYKISFFPWLDLNSFFYRTHALEQGVLEKKIFIQYFL